MSNVLLNEVYFHFKKNRGNFFLISRQRVMIFFIIQHEKRVIQRSARDGEREVVINYLFFLIN
jgi:hypothetical protein